MVPSPAFRVALLAAAMVALLCACTEEPPAISMSIAMAPVPASLPYYDRSEWRHWTDDDGDCRNARHEVLAAESISVVEYADYGECRVAYGEWVGPFTGVRFTDPADLQVDHLVPLANAHASGGWVWDRSRKSSYANDLSFDGHLVAVYGPANQAKGKSGPEDWKPPNRAYWCQYAIDWVTVKNSWGLTATEAEVAALAEMLGTCEPRRTLVGVQPEAWPAGGPPSQPNATAQDSETQGWLYDSCGEAEAAGEERVRGNSGNGKGFPQWMVPSARDGDSDGVVCER